MAKILTLLGIREDIRRDLLIVIPRTGDLQNCHIGQFQPAAHDIFSYASIPFKSKSQSNFSSKENCLSVREWFPQITRSDYHFRRIHFVTPRNLLSGPKSVKLTSGISALSYHGPASCKTVIDGSSSQPRMTHFVVVVLFPE